MRLVHFWKQNTCCEIDDRPAWGCIIDVGDCVTDDYVLRQRRWHVITVIYLIDIVYTPLLLWYNYRSPDYRGYFPCICCVIKFGICSFLYGNPWLISRGCSSPMQNVGKSHRYMIAEEDHINRPRCTLHQHTEKKYIRKRNQEFLYGRIDV